MNTRDEPRPSPRHRNLPPKTHRLFFGLAPPAAVRQRLAELQHRLFTPAKDNARMPIKGRPVVPANLHLTLVFLGQVRSEYIPAIEQAAGAVAPARFDLTLDRLGYWSRPKVLWAGSTQTPSVLIQLAADLNNVLQTCGHRPDPRDYQAHLTLARKVRRPSALPSIAPIPWPVQAFHLFESVAEARGVRYEALHTWTVQG